MLKPFKTFQAFLIINYLQTTQTLNLLDINKVSNMSYVVDIDIKHIHIQVELRQKRWVCHILRPVF